MSRNETLMMKIGSVYTYQTVFAISEAGFPDKGMEY